MKLGLLIAIAAMLLLGIAAPAIAAPPATSSGTSGRVTFGVEPASATGPDGRSGFAFSVTPGGVLFDHVAVVNYSTVSLALQLYATDAIETSGGGFGLLPARVKPTGVGSWLSLPASSATVVVPPRTALGPGHVVVPITLHVPLHVAPGDHSGGIVVSLQTTGKSASGENVVLDQRVGTRVIIQVAGALAPHLTLSDFHATYRGTLNPIGTGRVKVSYVVRNSGNVNLALDQGVDVKGLIESAGPVDPGRVPLLLPGASLHFAAVVTGVWPQVLVHDTVTAHPTEINVVGAPKLVAATVSTWTWAIPWPLIVIVLVLVLAIVVGWRARRRRMTPDVGQRSAQERQKVSA